MAAVEPLVVPLAGMPPPHEVHERLAARHATTFILESTAGPGRVSRYSIVGWDPLGVVALDRSGLKVTGPLPAPAPGEPPLDYLRRLLAAHAVPNRPDLPFVGGLVGSVGHEFARTLEPVLEPGAPATRIDDWPRLLMGLYTDAVVYDHVAGTVHYVSVGSDRRSHVTPLQDTPLVRVATLHVGPLAATADRARYTQQVRDAQALLQAGECFQIVLSRAYLASFRGDLGDAYRALRSGEPAPYLYHLRFGRRALLGASPETLVRVRHGHAETFPIAGTRPYTGDKAADANAARDLLADRKEAAEHAMLVDLARNDLSRVCRPGTVRVARLRDVEPARTVQHLVSHVVGDLDAGQDALGALAAVFPAGTVSGAPKVRALQHLQSLEGRARGAYAGAVVYASFSGDLDSVIAIRSLSANGDRLAVQAGAGIVLASDPDGEFDETRRKAATILSALRPFGAMPPRDELEVPAR